MKYALILSAAIALSGIGMAPVKASALTGNDLSSTQKTDLSAAKKKKKMMKRGTRGAGSMGGPSAQGGPGNKGRSGGKDGGGK